MSFLIVGLGNIGSEYAKTRHNIGFETLIRLAKKIGLKFQEKSKLSGFIAQGVWEGKKVILLLPTTYMNESGQAVRKCVDYFQIPTDHILVVVDDVDLEFLHMRLKDHSGSGGHNGLKSIEKHLQTNAYPRLRLGIGRDQRGASLVGHVLGGFSAAEKKQMPTFLDQALDVIQIWIQEGMQKAMQAANAKLIKLEEENKE